MKYGMEGTRLWVATTAAMILALTLGIMLQAARSDRVFSVTIDPTAATVGETKQYTITITNVGSGGGASANLGSAIIQVPAGFTVTVSPELAISTSPGKTWKATLNGTGTEILLSGDQGNDTFSPGDFVAVVFTATASGTAGAYEWTTTL